MTSARLELEGLTVGWHGVPTLTDVTLDVQPGETVALLGESGSGKSTLLRTVAGLLPPLSGRVRVGGGDITERPAHLRRIGLVFQSHALFPHASVGANISFAARLAGATKAKQLELANQWLERVGLDGLAARDVATLSGGQRQRVALARSLAADPSVLLLDEPLGALDAGLRAKVLSDLRTLFTELGTTAVHVTHDPAEAATLADRVAVLESGHLAQVGTPLEIHARPASAVVARLTGHPNVVKASDVQPASDGGDGWLVIPPAAIAFGPPPARHTAIGRGRIQVVLPGTVTTATVLVRETTLVVALSPAQSLPPGTEVDVAIDLDLCVPVAPHSAFLPAR